MDYFKRDVNEGGGEDTKLVGAVVPTNLFYYFNLFCVVDKRSKSSIIRPLIEDWLKQAVKDYPEKELIKLAAKMGYESYKNRTNKKRPFNIVINQQKRELIKKGVSPEIVNSIIKKIENLKQKEASEKKIERIINERKKIKERYEKNNKSKE